MFSVLYCEILKLKRSWILLITVIPAIICSRSILNIYSDKDLYPFAGWDVLFSENQLFLCKVAPVFFAILVGFVFSREYKNHTISNIFTTPFSRIKTFLTKLITLLLIITLTILISNILIFIFGRFVVSGKPSAHTINVNGKAMLSFIFTHFALVSVIALIGIVAKNNIAPSVFGLVAGMINMFLLLTRYKFYFPWSFPSIITGRIYVEIGYLPDGYYGRNELYSTVIFSVVVIIAFVSGMVYFLKSDVHGE